MKRLKKIFRVIILSINLGFIGLLLLSYLGGWVNPQSTLGIGLYFLSLAYPVWVIVNIIFCFFWIYRKRWYFALSLIAIGLGYSTFHNTFPILLHKKQLPPPATVKIMTYNVGGFYRGDNYNRTVKGVFDMVLQQHADVVCLQEMNLVNSGRNQLSEDELFFIMKDYPYKAVHYKSIRKYVKRGDFIFSKFPIQKKGYIGFKKDPFLDILYVDIYMKGEKVRLFTPHLNPNRLKMIDSDFYGEIASKDQEALKGELKYLVKSLGRGARNRGDQVDVFREKIEDSPYPVIVAGDFNDTPATYTYKQLRKGLIDSKVQNSSGLGATYNGNYPSFRIDYILHDPCFSSYEYKKYNYPKLSDHDAISVELDVSGCK